MTFRLAHTYSSIVSIINRKIRSELEFVTLEHIREDPTDPTSTVLEYKPLPNAEVSLEELVNDSTQRLIYSKMSNESGVGSFPLEWIGANYIIRACKPGFGCKSDTYNTYVISGKKQAITLTMEREFNKE